jgi:hypothetical protein
VPGALRLGDERYHGTGHQDGLDAGHAIGSERERLSERRHLPRADRPGHTLRRDISGIGSRSGRGHACRHQQSRSVAPAAGDAGGTGREGSIIVYILAWGWSLIGQDKSGEYGP